MAEDLDHRSVRQSMTFDPTRVAEIRERWTRLMELAVWGDLRAEEIGGLPQLRKRMLALGEKVRSLFNDRSWIPRPREQVRSVLTASLDVRDKLQAAEKELDRLGGGKDLERVQSEFDALRKELLALMESHEALWRDLLNRLYDGYDKQESTRERGDPQA